MEHEIEEFRAWVASLKLGRPGRRYPEDVRLSATRLAAKLEATGLRPHAVGRRLGIRPETLASWGVPDAAPRCAAVVVDGNEARSLQQREFRPEPEPAPTLAPMRPGESRLTVTSPSGWRIEGVRIEAIAYLTEVLP